MAATPVIYDTNGFGLSHVIYLTGCPASYQQKNEKKLWQFAEKNAIFTKKE